MVKAVFINYSDIVIQNKGDDYDELINRFIKNSHAEDAKEVFKWLYDTQAKLEEDANEGEFLSAEDIAIRVLEKSIMSWGFKDNYNDLHQIWKNHWMYGPIYNDVIEFLRQCNLPVYVYTHTSEQYVRVNFKRNNLHVHGILSAEAIKAYRPKKEVYDAAVEMCECQPEEILWVTGDSEKDAISAAKNQFVPIVLNRFDDQKQETSFKTIYRLTDILRLL